MRNVAILILALFWPRTFLFAANATKDPLWSKALAVAAANADWVPGLVITRSEVLQRGGSLEFMRCGSVPSRAQGMKW